MVFWIASSVMAPPESPFSPPPVADEGLKQFFKELNFWRQNKYQLAETQIN
jgi:hypothetical protein